MEIGINLILEEITKSQSEIDTLDVAANDESKKVKLIEIDMNKLQDSLNTKIRQASSIRQNIETKRSKIATIKAVQTTKQKLIDSIKNLTTQVSSNASTQLESSIRDFPLTKQSNVPSTSATITNNKENNTIQETEQTKSTPHLAFKLSSPNNQADLSNRKYQLTNQNFFIPLCVELILNKFIIF